MKCAARSSSTNCCAYSCAPVEAGHAVVRERGRLCAFRYGRPDKARFVDQDFNRVWTAAKLDDLTTRSSELDRARAMRPVVDTVDLLLDLHSMHEKSAPLIVAGPLKKGTELAVQLGTPDTVICDEGHPEGRRMRDYEGFGDQGSPKKPSSSNAVSIGRKAPSRWLAIAPRAFCS